MRSLAFSDTTSLVVWRVLLSLILTLSVSVGASAFASESIDGDCNRALIRQYYAWFDGFDQTTHCDVDCVERLEKLTSTVSYTAPSWFKRVSGQKWVTEFRIFSPEQEQELSTLLMSFKELREFRQAAPAEHVAKLIAMLLEKLHVPFQWREIEVNKVIRHQIVLKPEVDGHYLNQFAHELGLASVDAVFDAAIFARFNASFEDRPNLPTMMALPFESLYLPPHLSPSVAHETVHFETWKKSDGKQTVIQDAQLFGAEYLQYFLGSINTIPEFAGHLRYAKRTSFDEAFAHRAGARMTDLLKLDAPAEHEPMLESSVQRMHALSLVHGHWFRQASALVGAYLHSAELRRKILINPLKRGASQLQHVALRIDLGEARAIFLLIPVPNDFDFAFSEIDKILEALHTEAIKMTRESVAALRARGSLDLPIERLVVESESYLRELDRAK